MQPFRLAAGLSNGAVTPIGETAEIPAVAVVHDDADPSESPCPGETMTPDSCAERLPSPGPQSVSFRRQVDLNCLPMVCHLVDEASGRQKEGFRNILF